MTLQAQAQAQAAQAQNAYFQQLMMDASARVPLVTPSALSGTSANANDLGSRRETLSFGAAPRNLLPYNPSADVQATLSLTQGLMNPFPGLSGLPNPVFGDFSPSILSGLGLGPSDWLQLPPTVIPGQVAVPGDLDSAMSALRVLRRRTEPNRLPTSTTYGGPPHYYAGQGRGRMTQPNADPSRASSRRTSGGGMGAGRGGPASREAFDRLEAALGPGSGAAGKLKEV